MVGIQVSDVATALQNCVPYLIFAGIVAVIAVIAMVAVMKLKKSTKYLVRTQAAIAIVAAVAIAANLILTGPMNTLVSLATGDGKITQESSAKAEALAETIAEEGIILLENENALP